VEMDKKQLIATWIIGVVMFLLSVKLIIESRRPHKPVSKENRCVEALNVFFRVLIFD
jgi:hypothetical protein